MAKVQIEITDSKSGAVDIRVNLDPPIDTSKGLETTPAQSLGAEIMHFISALGGEQVEVEGDGK